TGGSLVLITFHAKSTAPLGSTTINFVPSNTPNGGLVRTSADAFDAPLTLNPAPTLLGNDSVDGIVNVINPAPSVTIDQAATQADPTNSDTIHFTVVFSKPTTDFATG